MPKLTCPECDTAFETAGARYTSCPGCGVRLDTRGGGPRAVGLPTRSPKTTSPYDTDLAEPPSRKPAKRYSGPIVVRKNDDGAPKVMLLLIVVGVVGLFGLFVGIAVIVYHVTGTDEPRMAAAPATYPADGGRAPTSVPTAPGSNATARPNPAGGLPGVDPADLLPGADDNAGMFPPGFPAMPGPPPGFPGGPGQVAPAPVSLVTLSNFRDGRGFAGSAELHLDYEYAAGAPAGIFDTLMIKSGTNVSQVRLSLLGRNKGTISVQLVGMPVGRGVEAWMERRNSFIPNGLGQKISNTVTK